MNNKHNIKSNSIHIIADFKYCKLDLLKSSKIGKEIIMKVIEKSNMHCAGITDYQFSPCGYTAAALLTESHLTLHSWPEFESVQIDIFTCGNHKNAYKAYDLLKEIFKPKKISQKILLRNLETIKVI